MIKRLLVAMVLASAAAPAYAQISAAIGKPLPSADIDKGTVSVRIVAGSPSKPVIGTDVTLVVNGATRVARTDDAGRAYFKDLPPGAKVQAKVLDEEKKEVASEEFEVPGDTGVRLMLTTLPWNPGAGAGMAGGAAGGAGGPMPNPRQMSGEPRPEQADPPGTLTARLTFDDFKDAPPVGVPVTLVGYGADERISMQVVSSDAEGRATFKGLDRSGGTSYFAMTLLERNGKLERLISVPAILDSRTGVRVILSGEKRTSDAPAVDDLTRFEKQDNAPPAGKVVAVLEGGADDGMAVSLVELKPTAGSKGEMQSTAFATAKAVAGAPDPSDLQTQDEFAPQANAPANTVIVVVHGGINGANEAIEGVPIHVAPVATLQEGQAAAADGTTDGSGSTKITVDPKTPGPYVATLTINGKTLASKPFDLATSGGVLDVEAHWSSEGKRQVTFDVVPRPGQVFCVQTVQHGQTFKSQPFQPVPERGTRVTLLIYPRVLFTFSLTSRIDDEYLAVNGRFEVYNYSWSPYAGTDGLIIPLPKGFVGGLVADRDQADVAIVPGEGFRIVRPLAPGKRAFVGAFSLPVNNGSVRWQLDLPFGSLNSGIEILQVPGMLVQTPPGVNGQVMTVEQGTYFVLPTISIMPKQAMVMTITGLPQPPAWKVWMPRVVGALVILIILTGLVFALARARGSSDGEREARRSKLLDELVELERSGKNAKRREQIMAELESLWDAA